LALGNYHINRKICNRSEGKLKVWRTVRWGLLCDDGPIYRNDGYGLDPGNAKACGKDS
jgi:hypothetical protein